MGDYFWCKQLLFVKTWAKKRFWEPCKSKTCVVCSNRKTSNVAAQSTFSSCGVTWGGMGEGWGGLGGESFEACYHLKVLWCHLWMSMLIIVERSTCLLKEHLSVRRLCNPALFQIRQWVQSPLAVRRWTVSGGVGGRGNSDEGDAYRDGGRLCPVLRGVMGNQMFHHCVFRHVLHKVCLLKKNKQQHKAQHFSPVQGEQKFKLTGSDT